MTGHSRRWGLSSGSEAGAYQFVAGARVNCYELGKHKPDLLTGRKLAEVLKVPMAFFYSDTDDEVAELLLRYEQASRAVRKRVSEVLKG